MCGRAAFTDVSGAPLTAPIWITASLGKWPRQSPASTAGESPARPRTLFLGFRSPGWSSTVAQRELQPIWRLNAPVPRSALRACGSHFHALALFGNLTPNSPTSGMAIHAARRHANSPRLKETRAATVWSGIHSMHDGE
jgi:hypothetical protein